eukprot:g3033.t1
MLGWDTDSRRSSGLGHNKRRSLSDSQIFSHHRRSSSISSCSGYADEGWDNITSASSAFSGPSAADEDDGFVSGENAGRRLSEDRIQDQEQFDKLTEAEKEEARSKYPPIEEVIGYDSEIRRRTIDRYSLAPGQRPGWCQEAEDSFSFSPGSYFRLKSRPLGRAPWRHRSPSSYSTNSGGFCGMGGNSTPYFATPESTRSQLTPYTPMDNMGAFAMQEQSSASRRRASSGLRGSSFSSSHSRLSNSRSRTERRQSSIGFNRRSTSRSSAGRNNRNRQSSNGRSRISDSRRASIEEEAEGEDDGDDDEEDEEDHCNSNMGSMPSRFSNCSSTSTASSFSSAVNSSSTPFNRQSSNSNSTSNSKRTKTNGSTSNTNTSVGGQGVSNTKNPLQEKNPNIVVVIDAEKENLKSSKNKAKSKHSTDDIENKRTCNLVVSKSMPPPPPRLSNEYAKKDIKKESKTDSKSKSKSSTGVSKIPKVSSKNSKKNQKIAEVEVKSEKTIAHSSISTVTIATSKDKKNENSQRNGEGETNKKETLNRNVVVGGTTNTDTGTTRPASIENGDQAAVVVVVDGKTPMRHRKFHKKEERSSSSSFSPPATTSPRKIRTAIEPSPLPLLPVSAVKSTKKVEKQRRNRSRSTTPEHIEEMGEQAIVEAGGIPRDTAVALQSEQFSKAKAKAKLLQQSQSQQEKKNAKEGFHGREEKKTMMDVSKKSKSECKTENQTQAATSSAVSVAVTVTASSSVRKKSQNKENVLEKDHQNQNSIAGTASVTAITTTSNTTTTTTGANTNAPTPASLNNCSNPPKHQFGVGKKRRGNPQAPPLHSAKKTFQTRSRIPPVKSRTMSSASGKARASSVVSVASSVASLDAQGRTIASVERSDVDNTNQLLHVVKPSPTVNCLKQSPSLIKDGKMVNGTRDGSSSYNNESNNIADEIKGQSRGAVVDGRSNSELTAIDNYVTSPKENANFKNSGKTKEGRRTSSSSSLAEGESSQRSTPAKFISPKGRAWSAASASTFLGGSLPDVSLASGGFLAGGESTDTSCATMSLMPSRRSSSSVSASDLVSSSNVGKGTLSRMPALQETRSKKMEFDNQKGKRENDKFENFDKFEKLKPEPNSRMTSTSASVCTTGSRNVTAMSVASSVAQGQKIALVTSTSSFASKASSSTAECKTIKTSQNLSTTKENSQKTDGESITSFIDASEEKSCQIQVDDKRGKSASTSNENVSVASSIQIQKGLQRVGVGGAGTTITATSDSSHAFSESNRLALENDMGHDLAGFNGGGYHRNKFSHSLSASSALPKRKNNVVTSHKEGKKDDVESKSKSNLIVSAANTNSSTSTKSSDSKNSKRDDTGDRERENENNSKKESNNDAKSNRKSLKLNSGSNSSSSSTNSHHSTSKNSSNTTNSSNQMTNSSGSASNSSKENGRSFSSLKDGPSSKMRSRHDRSKNKHGASRPPLRNRNRSRSGNMNTSIQSVSMTRKGSVASVASVASVTSVSSSFSDAGDINTSIVQNGDLNMSNTISLNTSAISVANLSHRQRSDTNGSRLLNSSVDHAANDIGGCSVSTISRSQSSSVCSMQSFEAQRLLGRYKNRLMSESSVSSGGGMSPHRIVTSSTRFTRRRHPSAGSGSSSNQPLSTITSTTENTSTSSMTTPSVSALSGAALSRSSHLLRLAENANRRMTFPGAFHTVKSEDVVERLKVLQEATMTEGTSIPGAPCEDECEDINMKRNEGSVAKQSQNQALGNGTNSQAHMPPPASRQVVSRSTTPRVPGTDDQPSVRCDSRNSVRCDSRNSGFSRGPSPFGSQRMRIKCRFDNDTRMIKVDPNAETFEMLISRVQKMYRGMLAPALFWKDSFGDYITIANTEDLETYFEEVQEQGPKMRVPDILVMFDKDVKPNTPPLIPPLSSMAGATNNTASMRLSPTHGFTSSMHNQMQNHPMQNHQMQHFSHNQQQHHHNHNMHHRVGGSSGGSSSNSGGSGVGGLESKRSLSHPQFHPRATTSNATSTTSIRLSPPTAFKAVRPSSNPFDSSTDRASPLPVIADSCSTAAAAAKGRGALTPQPQRITAPNLNLNQNQNQLDAFNLRQQQMQQQQQHLHKQQQQAMARSRAPTPNPLDSTSSSMTQNTLNALENELMHLRSGKGGYYSNERAIQQQREEQLRLLQQRLRAGSPLEIVQKRQEHLQVQALRQAYEHHSRLAKTQQLQQQILELKILETAQGKRTSPVERLLAKQRSLQSSPVSMLHHEHNHVTSSSQQSNRHQSHRQFEKQRVSSSSTKKSKLGYPSAFKAKGVDMNSNSNRGGRRTTSPGGTSGRSSNSTTSPIDYTLMSENSIQQSRSLSPAARIVESSGAAAGAAAARGVITPQAIRAPLSLSQQIALQKVALKRQMQQIRDLEILEASEGKAKLAAAGAGPGVDGGNVNMSMASENSRRESMMSHTSRGSRRSSSSSMDLFVQTHQEEKRHLEHLELLQMQLQDHEQHMRRQERGLDNEVGRINGFFNEKSKKAEKRKAKVIRKRRYKNNHYKHGGSVNGVSEEEKMNLNRSRVSCDESHHFNDSLELGNSPKNMENNNGESKGGSRGNGGGRDGGGNLEKMVSRKSTKLKSKCKNNTYINSNCSNHSNHNLNKAKKTVKGKSKNKFNNNCNTMNGGNGGGTSMNPEMVNGRERMVRVNEATIGKNSPKNGGEGRMNSLKDSTNMKDEKRQSNEERRYRRHQGVHKHRVPRDMPSMVCATPPGKAPKPRKMDLPALQELGLGALDKQRVAYGGVSSNKNGYNVRKSKKKAQQQQVTEKIKYRSQQKWVDDSNQKTCSAPNCGTNFSFFNRRHHCRACGKIFCATCVSARMCLSPKNRVLSPARSQRQLHRVCTACHDEIAEEKRQIALQKQVK